MKIKFKKSTPITVAVDVVIFTIENQQLKVLLIQRARAPFSGSWALPGGFLGIRELIGKAASRVLKDKAGVHDVYIEQLYTFDASGRDPRGHIPTVAYFALVPFSKLKFGHGKDLQKPTLYPIRKLPKLAFDHKSIIAYALKRLGAKLEYTNIVYSLLPQEFRLYDLQRIYEEVWGKKLNKRNFQKKIFSLGLLRKTGKVLGGHHRPAKLYRFISRKPSDLKDAFG